jgi:hypothetical protein
VTLAGVVEAEEARRARVEGVEEPVRSEGRNVGAGDPLDARTLGGSILD